MGVEPVILEKASIWCYRLFDIAHEIHLERAQTLLAADVRRLRLTREGSQYLELPNPPLVVELGKRTLKLRDGDRTADAVARVFDHGAASIILKVPIEPGTSIDALVPLADELYDTKVVEDVALELLEALRRLLAPAIEAAHLWDQNESYTVIFAEEIRGRPLAKEVLERADLARLLLGEVGPHPLSAREREEVTRHWFSYTEADLAVVDWNSAFVYEPSGSTDIPDIMEICNAQLLELRYYDDLLDQQLARIYDEMQSKPRPNFSLFRSPYRAMARRVLVTLMEFSEFVERVENSLKIVGDFYLAKLYEATVRRMRIPLWQAEVQHKQQMLANIYQLLKGEVDTDRSLTLEIIIIALIIGELLLALGPWLRHV
jgi:hypothetical protein